MSENVDMAMILNRSMERSCPACGQKQESREPRCSACGVEMEVDEEDSAFSVMSEGPERTTFGTTKTPLESSKNFIALKKAAAGAQDGSMPDEEYRQIIKRLGIVADTGVRLFETDQYKAKFANASKLEQALNLEMQAAFAKLYKGVLRMNEFLKTRNVEDVKEGAALAEAAYVAIDDVQDRAMAADTDI